MIVLKTTRDKVLAVLQSVAGIVMRRHTLPILANVLCRRTASLGFMELDLGTLVLEAPARHSAEVFALFSRPMAKVKQALALNLPPQFLFQRQGQRPQRAIRRH